MRRRPSRRGRVLVGPAPAHSTNGRVPSRSTRPVPWRECAGGSASAEGSHHVDQYRPRRSVGQRIYRAPPSQERRRVGGADQAEATSWLGPAAGGGPGRPGLDPPGPRRPARCHGGDHRGRRGRPEPGGGRPRERDESRGDRSWPLLSLVYPPPADQARTSRPASANRFAAAASLDPRLGFWDIGRPLPAKAFRASMSGQGGEPGGQDRGWR
jgi:hypothetical protein